ncbi:nickel-responsive transcriptional regulator NikR [Candidatus Woesearchaeota archaeon]|nr:nickel-responsive transcriptional regulator NikR [Candidatus Woesearchaeota archaeon]
MDKIIRKGIAFDAKVLRQFDDLIREKGYKNRSEAIRDLVRMELVEQEMQNPEAQMMGTLTIVYEHHRHHVQDELTHIQHHHPDLIRSSLHIHINPDNCLEVIVLEGMVKNIQKLADEIIAAKGVKYGKIVMTSLT